MTPAEQLRAMRATDLLRTSVPRIDHGRMRGRAHRAVALRLVRAFGLAAVSAVVLFVAGAQLPVAMAGEPGDGGTDGPVDDGGSDGDGESDGDGGTDDDGGTNDDGDTDDDAGTGDGEVETLPDLVVGIDAFGQSSWTLTVKNEGGGDAGPFVVEVSPGEPFEFQDGLAAGGSESRSIEPCDTREAELLVASVDPDGQVPEVDEANNTAQHPCDPYVE